MKEDFRKMDEPQRSHTGPRGRPQRPIHIGLALVIALALGVAACFFWSPSIKVALSAAEAWFVFLLFGVAAWEWLAMMTGFDRYPTWLPKHPLPGWFSPLRSSFVVILFFYGIIVGHFWWR